MPRASKNPASSLQLLASSKAQAAVELAIVAPIVLLLLVGAVGLADAGRKKAILSRAALQGSRLAVVKEGPDIEAFVKRVATAADSSIDPTKLGVKVEPISIPVVGLAIKPVRVTVIYDMPMLVGFGWSPEIRLRQSYVFEKWDNGIIFNIPAKS